MANLLNRRRWGASNKKDAKAMGDMLGGAKSGARGTIYTRTVGKVEKERALSGRAIAALALLVLLPPVGIALIWRRQMFLTRGRILLTLVGTLVLALMFMPLMRRGTLQNVVPAPSVPSKYTPAPQTDAQADFDLINQLSDAAQVANAVNVYTADGDALYHAAEVCGERELSRVVTLAEALESGLTACPDCNAPKA